MMSLPLKQLEAEALELSVRERAQLAHRLIVSLDEDVMEDPAEVERAWDEEISRRLAEVEAGTAELIPADQVFAELRARARR
jgi:putative addiction module component (TIGR02574 family)